MRSINSIAVWSTQTVFIVVAKAPHTCPIFGLIGGVENYHCCTRTSSVYSWARFNKLFLFFFPARRAPPNQNICLYLYVSATRQRINQEQFSSQQLSHNTSKSTLFILILVFLFFCFFQTIKNTSYIQVTNIANQTNTGTLKAQANQQKRKGVHGYDFSESGRIRKTGTCGTERYGYNHLCFCGT